MSEPVNGRKIGMITAGVLLLVVACAYLGSTGAYVWHEVSALPPAVIEPMHQTGPTTYSMSVVAFSAKIPNWQHTGTRVALLAAGVGIILIIAGVCTRNPPEETG